MGIYISKILNFMVIAFCVIPIFYWIKNKEVSFNEMGFSFKKYSIVDIFAGLFIGFIAMSGIFLVHYIFDFINIIPVNKIQVRLFSFMLTILFYAFYEEIIFRGFMLNGMTIIFKKKYISVILSSLIFGLMHANNPNATLISILSNSLGGAMYAIAFIGSNNLWMSTSLHFAWNFFQGPIYGFPVSGFNMGGIFIHGREIGTTLLTGGNYGPEGGIIGITFRVVIIIMLLLYFKIRNSKMKCSRYKEIRKF